MKIVGTVDVTLPFSLDYCAEGPDVPPIEATLGGIDCSIALPPSMGEKTDGRSFFQSGWAWWTGSLLSLQLSRDVTPEDSDFDAVRMEFERAANELLRRFLGSYRIRFRKPGIYPVRIESKLLTMEVEQDDGSRSAFPESVAAFFYSKLPSEPPLTSSLNKTTISQIEADIADSNFSSVDDHLALDIEWLESLGESERAAKMKTLL